MEDGNHACTPRVFEFTKDAVSNVFGAERFARTSYFLGMKFKSEQVVETEIGMEKYVAKNAKEIRTCNS